MSSPVYMFFEGGPMMYVVLGLAVCGLLPLLLWSVLGFTKRRAPLALWLLGPGAVLLTGFIGTAFGNMQVLEAIAYASTESRAMLAAMGNGVALYPELLARWGAAALLALGAWGAGLAAVITTGAEAKRTLGAGILGVLLTGAGVVAVPLYAVFALNANWAVVPATLLVGFAALGSSVGSFRRGVGPNAHRIGAMRMASYAQVLLCAWHVGLVLTDQAWSSQMTLMAQVGPEHAAEMWGRTQVDIEAANTVGWMLFAWVFLLGLVTTLAELGDVLVGATVADLAISGLGLGLLFGVSTWAHSLQEQVRSLATHGPIGQVVASRLTDLPPAVFDGEMQQVGLPAFSQVLEEKSGRWTRTWRLAEGGWEQEATALEQIDEAGAPVLVMDGGASAESLGKALQRTDFGVLLLFGASEVPEGLDADSAFLLLQGISLAAVSADEAKGSLWAQAGDERNPFLGSVPLADEALDRGQTERIASALGEFPDLVVVPGKGRVSDVVELCLARPQPTEPCRILVGSTLGQWRDGQPVPDAKGVQITRIRTRGEVEMAAVRASLEPHLANVARCGAVARDVHRESGSGRWGAIVTFSGTGRVSQIEQARRNEASGTFLDACLRRELDQLVVDTSVEGGEADLQLYLP